MRPAATRTRTCGRWPREPVASDARQPLALISDDSHAGAAWADTRYGTLATNKQVIECASPSFTAQCGLLRS
ncbi:MAG TPA: hypothetical protein VG371_09165 [Solirubrobacteraceae bacterium]|jgi:hypothetical protein|nr:hypothetical protein [Solirubrobacteraceae bacterium]